ncbi:helix-turn-helix domain-containing protein [Shewanella sp.]|uniref:helix-turn-helix domain-containing protein n=1 Tax=Shewanella sp. TaxID=50422 RepID=UPI004047F397
MNVKRIGKTIKERRDELGVSATDAAAAAGISRVTLHRIEHGEGAPSLQNYCAVLTALGMQIDVNARDDGVAHQPKFACEHCIPAVIYLDDFPGLKRIAWHVTGRNYLKPQEAWNLYERNARFLAETSLSERERELIQNLERAFA